MKAAVCYEFGQPLVIEELDIDQPYAGEVLVRIAAVSICACDLHIIDGHLGGTEPVVAGHEAAGVVSEVGAGVTRVRTGDRVAISSIAFCGQCPQCSRGAPHLCEQEFALRKASRLRTKTGQIVQHGALTAAFAEQVIVDESQLFKLPDDMSFDCAALLGCTVITGTGAALRTAQVRAGSSVAVVGLGAVGLSVVQGAKLAAAKTIIGVDLLEKRREIARALGATHTVNPQTDQIETAVKNIVGAGLNYVFITAGTTATIEEGFELLGKGGKEVIVGFQQLGTSAAFDAGGFVFAEKQVTGTVMGSADPDVDLSRLVAAHRAGQLRLDALITARYPLTEINEALQQMRMQRALRNILIP